MKHHELIKNTLEFVKRHHANEFSGHDFEHVRRVWINSKKILETEDSADTILVELTALLHDVDDWKISGNKKTTFADDYMKEISLDNTLREKVNNIISVIGFKGDCNLERLTTIEAKIIFDADKLDGIGAIGISRAFAFGGHVAQPIFDPNIFPIDRLDRGSYLNLKRKDNNSINHFFDKLLLIKNLMQTNTGKLEAKERHDFMVSFLKNFFEEQDCKEWSDYLEKFLIKKNRVNLET